MLLKRIKIQNLKVLGDRHYSLEPLTLITGPNSSGKTAILDACYLALTGEHPIGKTAKKVAQMAAGATMSASVESDSGSWSYSIQGRTIDRSRAGHWQILSRAEQYAEAGSTARYNLLGSSSDLDKLLGVVHGAKEAVSAATRTARRLGEALKTEGLAMAKMKNSTDADLEAAAVSLAARTRIAEAREILERLPRETRQGPCPAKPAGEFVAATLEDVQKAHEGLGRQIKAAEANLDSVTEDDITATRMSCSEARDQLASVKTAMGEWEASSKGKYDEAVVSLAQDQGLAKLLREVSYHAQVEKEECPVCFSKFPGFYQFLADRAQRLVAATLEDEAMMAEHRPPFDGNAIKAAESLQESKSRYLAELEKRFEVKAGACKKLEQDRHRLVVLEEAVLTLTARARWAAALGAEAVVKAATTEIEKHNHADKRNQQRLGLSLQIEATQKSLNLVTDQLAAAKTNKANAESEYRAAAATELANLLATAGGLLHNIVPGRVTSLGSEVLIVRDAVEITWAAMSGSERLAIGLALKMACSNLDGVLLVDELGVLTEQARGQFLQNIKGELEAGRIKQALVVVPGRLECPGWHTIELGKP